MIKSVINILEEIALRHKGVSTFKYQSDALNNAQQNDHTFQVYVDDVTNGNILTTQNNIFTLDIEMYILATPIGEETVLDVQDKAYAIALDMVAFIDTHRKWIDKVSVHDYSILTLSHYTDNDSAGVKLSLVLRVPNPVCFAHLEHNFHMHKPIQVPEKPLDVENEEIGDIDIKTIDLEITIPQC